MSIRTANRTLVPFIRTLNLTDNSSFQQLVNCSLLGLEELYLENSLMANFSFNYFPKLSVLKYSALSAYGTTFSWNYINVNTLDLRNTHVGVFSGNTLPEATLVYLPPSMTLLDNNNASKMGSLDMSTPQLTSFSNNSFPSLEGVLQLTGARFSTLTV